MANEEPKYSLTQKNYALELRTYRSKVIAGLTISGSLHEATSLDFVNIHYANDTELLSMYILLKRLHMRKAYGEWLVELDTNLYVWSQTPYADFFNILKIWPIRSLANYIYTRWADRRFKKRYHCEECKL